MEFFTYIAKSAGILTLFYTVYILVLRKDTFFSANRSFLLAGIVAALLLPFLTFTTTTLIEIPVSTVNDATSEFVPTNFITPTSVQETLDIWQLILWGYSIGMGIMGIRFLVQLSSLIRFLQKNPSKKIGRHRFVKIYDETAPFSFFNYIVFNPETHEQDELEMILQHEKIHASQWHSIDLLFSNMIRVLQWVNPIAWFYKKSMEANLEFLADCKTVSSVSSKTKYQLALLKASSPLPVPALTNNFYQSFIKKRIIMLNKSNSNKYNRLKLALVLPALAIFLWSFNTEEIITYTTLAPSEISSEEITAPTPESAVFTFSATSTHAELNTLENYFLENLPESLVKIDDRKRNNAGELISFSFKTKFEGENRFYTRFDRGAEAPFQTIYKIEPQEKGVLLVSEIGKDGMQFKITKEQLQMIASGNKSLDIRSKSVKAKDTLKVNKPLFGENPLYIINGKEYRKKELPENKTIALDGTVAAYNQKEGQAKYGTKGKDGVLFFNGVSTFTQPAKIASEKENNILKQELAKIPPTVKEIRIKITKNTTKEELDGFKKELKDLHDVNLTYSNINYNTKGEMTSIAIQYSGNGNNGSYSVSSDDGEAIDEFFFYMDTDKGTSGFASEKSKEMLENRAAMMAKRHEIRGQAMEERKEMLESRRTALAEMREKRNEDRNKMRADRNEMLRARQEVSRTRSTMQATGQYNTRDIRITKNTTDAELAKLKIDLAERDIVFNYKRVKRNSKGEITGIKATFDNGKGSKISKSVQIDDDEGIAPIVVKM